MNQKTIRLMLRNQLEIMSALASVCAKSNCQASVKLLQDRAHKTSNHLSKHYPTYANSLSEGMRDDGDE